MLWQILVVPFMFLPDKGSLTLILLKAVIAFVLQK